MTGDHSSRSTRWTIGLLLALGVVTAVGGWLLIRRLSGPTLIELLVSAPAGEEIYYDIVLDGVASSGVATVPARLTFHGRGISFAVITKRSTASDLKLSLSTRHAGGTQQAPGVTGTFVHSSLLSQMTMRPMTRVHVANMRRARESKKEDPVPTQEVPPG